MVLKLNLDGFTLTEKTNNINLNNKKETEFQSLFLFNIIPKSLE